MIRVTLQVEITGTSDGGQYISRSLVSSVRDPLYFADITRQLADFATGECAALIAGTYGQVSP